MKVVLWPLVGKGAGKNLKKDCLFSRILILFAGFLQLEQKNLAAIALSDCNNCSCVAGFVKEGGEMTAS